jgi:DNA-binding transcriptional regulator YiaG
MSKQASNVTNKIKALRIKLGISQEDLARELGVSFATVNRWENDKTQPSKLAKKQLEQFILHQKQQGALKDE